MAMCTGQSSSDGTSQTRIPYCWSVTPNKTAKNWILDERCRAEYKLGDAWKCIPYLASDMMVR